MRNKHLFGMALAAVMTAACSYVDEPVDAPRSGGLSATVEGSRSSTRAGFAEDGGVFYWSNTDCLGVTTDKSTTAFSTLTLKTGGGTASATFEGNVSGEIEGYAIYPVSDYHRLNGNTLTYHLPEAYTYTKVDADYSTETQGNGNSFNPPMWGKINDASTGKYVTLKHLGGVLCVKIPEMPVDAGTFILSADEQITGNFTADLNDAEPVIATPTEEGAAATATPAVSGNNEVTITFSRASKGSPGVFYVPVPTGTYHNVRVKVTDGIGAIAKVNVVVGTYEVARRDLKKIEPNSGSVDATVVIESESLEKAAAALVSNDAVAVTSEITSSSSNEIAIPGASSSTGATSKSLSLEKVASGASLTVNDENASGAADASVQNFTLSIPNNDSSDDPLDVTINMPNTTVTLAGNGGVATYGEVTASTAENTLVLSSGVKVNKVIVNKGNIRVNKGAELVAIEKGDGNDATVTIYKEEGATLPSNLDGFEVVDVATYDLMMACANGGTYTLTTNVTGDFVVSATEEVIINLNGYTVTNKAGDTFTVNNGSKLTISGNGTVDNVTHQKACIYNNGTVVLNGGAYTRSKEASTSVDDANGNSYYNILNHGEMTINDGVTISSKGAFSSLIDNGYYNYTSTNERIGYVSGKGWQNPSLQINGGSFSGGINTIKNDDGATLTIEGGTFANTTQATVQNNNVATIKGGVYSPTNSATDAVQTRYYNSGYNAGQTIISGGAFNGTLYVEGEGASLQISRGTFSDPEALQYLANNANVKIVIDNDKDCRGFVTKAGQTVELDLQNHTLTLTDPTVGSTGTETNSCQLLKDSKVTFRNGTLHSKNENIVIQNYCTLLLDNMILDTPKSSYSISNNNGSCTLQSTVINNSVGCAFDVYYWPKNGYTDGVTVRVVDSTITGKVEFGGSRLEGDTTMRGKLLVEGQSVMNGNLTVDTDFYNAETPNIVIGSSVTFGEGVTGWESYISSSTSN